MLAANETNEINEQQCNTAADEWNLFERCEVMLSGHQAQCNVTTEILKNLLENDDLLNDIPYDITLEEVRSQISIIQGDSISISIKRGDLSTLKIVVPRSGTTVGHLKKAIQRQFELDQQRKHQRLQITNTTTIDDHNKPANRQKLKITSTKRSSLSSSISWKHIWRMHFLQLDETDQYLRDDRLLLADLNVQNKCVMKFVRKNKSNNPRH